MRNETGRAKCAWKESSNAHVPKHIGNANFYPYNVNNFFFSLFYSHASNDAAVVHFLTLEHTQDVF